MLYNILLAFMILVCILMIVVILLQRSEGGALGMGGGTSGFMTARGAGNLLTRTTWVLASLFFACAILLILEGNRERHSTALESLKFAPGATAPLRPAQAPAAASGAAAPATAAPAAPASSAPDLGDLESKAKTAPSSTGPASR
jgi:preprotein translocase subunit SecG